MKTLLVTEKIISSDSFKFLHPESWPRQRFRIRFHLKLPSSHCNTSETDLLSTQLELFILETAELAVLLMRSNRVPVRWTGLPLIGLNSRLKRPELTLTPSEVHFTDAALVKGSSTFITI
jgi:hypothetical protein